MPIRGHSGVQGGAEMGAYATVFPGGVPITHESAANLEAQYGFPIHAAARALGGRDGRGGRPRRDGRPVVQRRQLPGHAAGPRWPCATPWSASRCASTRTSWSARRCWSTATMCCCCPPQPATNSPAAARRPPPSAAWPSPRRSRIRASARRAASGRSSATCAAAVDPERAKQLVGWQTGQEIREEIARVVPFYDGIQHLAKTGDQIQWGGERCATTGPSRPPTARPTSPWSSRARWS